MLKKQGRLGRGLEALIPKVSASTDGQLVSLKVSDIRMNPYQPRVEFDEDSLLSLSESIKKNGVVQPVLVRRIETGYELVAGERRYRAAMLAGLERIPAVVRSLSDEESLRIALVENLDRRDLNPLEIARGYQRLIEEFSLSHQDISEMFGKSRSAVSNVLRLLNLPEVIQSAVFKGLVSEGHARALLSLVNEDEMLAYFNKIQSEKLSVRSLEDIVKIKKKKKDPAAQLSLFGHFEKNSLRNTGVRVR